MCFATPGKRDILVFSLTGKTLAERIVQGRQAEFDKSLSRNLSGFNQKQHILKDPAADFCSTVILLKTNFLSAPTTLNHLNNFPVIVQRALGQLTPGRQAEA